MIVFLDGRIASIGLGFVDLDVHQVGYRVFVTDETISGLALDQQVRFYTHHHVREDAMILYGFLRDTDRAVFERLITVSGVGPKVAMQMLGALPAEPLVAAIRREDAGTLCTLPGVGKKTAQRMILDLKDKLDDLPISWDEVVQVEYHPLQPDLAQDVSAALVALGYRPKEANSAVEAILQGSVKHTLESAMKASLKWLYEHQSEGKS